MLKRIIIVPLLLATLCTIIALPVSAQVEGYRLVRKAERMADQARTDRDRKKAERVFQAALAKFREHNNEKGQSHALNGLGILYADRGEVCQGKGVLREIP